MSGRAELTWRDGGIPVSSRFEDPYFSLADGLEETRHVFLAGNGLPERFRDGFQIAELGFGTGLNLIAAVLAWGDRPGRFRYTSFEAFPMTAQEMSRALAAFPETAPLAPALVAAWGGAWETTGETGVLRFALGPADVDIIADDARAALPRWQGRADAWFLDGFSPARNPELWGEELMAEVARHTALGGSFATYTAAGHVRRALAAAGFAVERLKGHGHKRHMSAGRLIGPEIATESAGSEGQVAGA